MKLVQKSSSAAALAAVVLSATLVAGTVGGPASASQRSPRAAPAPTADYGLERSLTSSVAGAPRLKHIEVNGGNFWINDAPPASNFLGFPVGNGVRLDNARTVLGARQYTIALFDVILQDIAGPSRLITFRGDGTPGSDAGVYVAGRDLVFRREVAPDRNPFVEGFAVDVVLTRTLDGRVRGYVDGVQQFSFIDTKGRAIIEPTVRFFQDDGDHEESAGAVSHIRLWNVPLTPTQVAALEI